MKNNKRRIIIVSAIVFVILAAVLVFILVIDAQTKEYEKEKAWRDSIKQEWYNALKEKADGETKFKLSDTTPFEWDELYIASGYYLKEDMVKLLGEKSKEVFTNADEGNPILLGTDLSTLWIFFLEDELVFELEDFDIFSPGERIEKLKEEDAWVITRILEGSKTVDVYVCRQGKESE